MVLQALRDALAAVPLARRRPDLDRAAIAACKRLQGLPLTAGDLPQGKQAAVLASALGPALDLARRLRGVNGYSPAAEVLYGLMAGLTGLPLPTPPAEVVSGG